MKSMFGYTPYQPHGLLQGVFFAETFRSFLLRHFRHWNISVMSHSCIKTCHNSFLSYICKHSHQNDL